MDLHLVGNFISCWIISKHFKMYITINNVTGEKMIDLFYPIHPRKEITVIRMLSVNVQYRLKGPMKILLKTGEIINLTEGVYTNRELNALMGMEVKLKFDSNEDVLKMNKLKGITEMILNLNELDNSDNLEDKRPSNILLTYHVTANEGFMQFEPKVPQYKKLKNDKITSLTLKITDQKNNIMTDAPWVAVVLHICDCRL